MLAAGVSTDSPSFNKHFIWPCTIVFGRRRVMNELLRIFENGSDRQKYGVAGAVYWCSMPREHTYWPHHHTHPVPKPPPDEPVDDLHEAFARAATEEFIRNPALDVQRALIPYIPRVRTSAPELFERALQAARAFSDEYVRSRLAYDLGDSTLIPCKPHPTE